MAQIAFVAVGIPLLPPTLNRKVTCMRNPEAILLLLGVILVIGFGLGYGVREWISRRRQKRYRDSML